MASDIWVMAKVADQIREWQEAYYRGEPAVSDAIFDTWWANLIRMELAHPELKDPNSPTVAVGY